MSENVVLPGVGENITLPGARIVDRGYQHYAGKRLGLAHAFWAMVRAALKRGLGIRRPARAKILPWLLIGAVYAPVLILLGLHVILPQIPAIPYTRIYESIYVVFALFAGLITPDLLCADRRERTLSLYFAAPITRWHYVAAQALGLALLLLLLTLVPMLLLFAGNALLAPAALSYVHDHLGDLWHIVLSGGLLAAYFGALALAVSALTDRRAYATGAYLGLLLVSAAAGTILWRAMSFAGHQSFVLVDLLTTPLRAVQWLFGAALEPTLSGWAYIGVTLGAIAASLLVLIWRYREVRD